MVFAVNQKKVQSSGGFMIWKKECRNRTNNQDCFLVFFVNKTHVNDWDIPIILTPQNITDV